MKNRVFPKYLYVVVPYRYFGVREPLSMEKYPHWLPHPYLCDFVFSNHSFHLEFQVILCDSKWNSKWRYLCKKVLPLYLFRIFRLSVRVRMLCGAETHQMCHSIQLICISLGIPSDSMWNSKWTYFCGLRQKSVLMVVVLYLYGFWKSSSALWCGGHRICRDNFTWNFT